MVLSLTPFMQSCNILLYDKLRSSAAPCNLVTNGETNINHIDKIPRYGNV